MNSIDVSIAIFALLGVITGYKNGLIRSLFFIVAVPVSYNIVHRFVSGETAFIVAYMGCIFLIVSLGSIASQILPFPRIVDIICGMILGFFAGFFGGGVLIFSIVKFYGKMELLKSSIFYSFISKIINL